MDKKHVSRRLAGSPDPAGKLMRRPGHSQKEFQEFFPRAVGMTGKAIRQRLDCNLADAGYNFTAEHVIVLFNLLHHNGLTQQQIAGLISRPKASTTRLVDFLENSGLVRRAADPADRRQNLVRLTAEGRKLLKKLRVLGEVTQKEALKGINRKDLQICKNVLWQVWQNLMAASSTKCERFVR